MLTNVSCLICSSFCQQAWGRLQIDDYDYEYDYKEFLKGDFDYDYDYTKLEVADYDYDYSTIRVS